MNVVLTRPTVSGNKGKPIYQRHLEAALGEMYPYTTYYQKTRYENNLFVETPEVLKRVLEGSEHIRSAGGQDSGPCSAKISSERVLDINDAITGRVRHEMSVAEVLDKEDYNDFDDYGIGVSCFGHEVDNPKKKFEKHIVGLGIAYHEWGEIQYVAGFAQKLEKTTVGGIVSLNGQRFKITKKTCYNPKF